MDKDYEIFEGKTFSSLIRDIYSNSQNKKDQINQLIKDLRSMVKDTGSATVIAPMIKDYMDVGVKNDDQLVKLSAVLQRLINSNGSSNSEQGGGDFILTDEEKNQLLKNVEKEIGEIKKSDESLTHELKSKLKDSQ